MIDCLVKEIPLLDKCRLTLVLGPNEDPCTRNAQLCVTSYYYKTADLLWSWNFTEQSTCFGRCLSFQTMEQLTTDCCGFLISNSGGLHVEAAFNRVLLSGPIYVGRFRTLGIARWEIWFPSPALKLSFSPLWMWGIAVLKRQKASALSVALALLPWGSSLQGLI